MVDPWGGFYEGMNNLNNTLVNVRAQDRQSALDAQNAAAARQQLAMGAVQLQGAQRSQQNLQDAQDAAAALQPTSRSMLVDQQGPPVPIANPNAPTDRSALSAQIQNMKAQEYNPAQSFGDNDVPPGTTNLTPEATAAQQQQIAPLQAQMAQPDQLAGAPLPQVEQQQQVPVTDADRMGAMIKSYMANGDTAKASELFKMAHDYAQAQGQINASGGGSLEDYYTKLTKASLTQTQSDQIEKALTTVALLAKEGPQYLKMAEPFLKTLPGMENFSADAVTFDPSKRFISIDAGNGQTIVYDQQNPKDWKLEKKDPINGDAIFVSGYRQSHPGASDAEVSRALDTRKAEIAHAGRVDARTTIVNNPTNTKPASGGLTDLAVDDAAKMYNITGTLPSGRNKEANAAIQNRAAELRQSSGQSAAGVVANAGDLKAVNQSINQQEKQAGSMGSFVKNIDKQVNRFQEISKDLNSFDTRLLNVPLRELRGKVAGSPLQAKVDMYLAEISSETGKLASGATGSVAELSQGSREKWEKIHDPNLSMADLLDVLKETRHAGSMRMDSVNEQLAATRAKRDSIGKGGNPYPQITAYIKNNLGKVDENALIAAIRHSNPTITNAELKAAYKAAKGQ